MLTLNKSYLAETRKSAMPQAKFKKKKTSGKTDGLSTFENRIRGPNLCSKKGTGALASRGEPRTECLRELLAAAVPFLSPSSSHRSPLRDVCDGARARGGSKQEERKEGRGVAYPAGAGAISTFRQGAIFKLRAG